MAHRKGKVICSLLNLFGERIFARCIIVNLHTLKLHLLYLDRLLVIDKGLNITCK